MSRLFDGIDDGITVADDPAFEFTTSESYTLCAWVRHSSLTGYQNYFRKDDGFASPRRILGFRKNGVTNVIECLLGTVGVDLQSFGGSTALTTDTWYFVALVRDVGADQIRLYLATASGDVTQEAAATDTTTTTHGENTRELQIGREFSPGSTATEVINGRMADVRVYGRALTVNELRGVKHGVILDAPLGHWPLWGVASPEPDLSGNRRNGIVVGAVAADHAPFGSYAGRAA